jgi:hypothetical protein
MWRQIRHAARAAQVLRRHPEIVVALDMLFQGF